MKNRYYWLCLLSFCVACQDEERTRSCTPEGEEVSVKFALASEQIKENTLSGTSSASDVEMTRTSPLTTRGDAEEGLIAQESVIGNVVVAQFNGITDESVLVGSPQYVATYDDETFDATLTTSEEQNTVVFIANVGDITAKITDGMTLSAFKGLSYDIPGQIIIENNDLPMVGLWTGVISMESLGANTQIVKVPMERVMAKIVLTANSEVSGLTITKVNVSNVPTSVGLYTPKTSAGFTTYTVGKYQGELDERYIWYMPENMSTADHTQVDIYASKDGKTYIYTTYLNVDEGEDYSVKRNTRYNLTATIKHLTDAVTEVDLVFDCHGETSTLLLKEVAIKRVPGFDPISTVINSGYVYALNMFTGDTNDTPLASECCDWIKIAGATTTKFDPSWLELDVFGKPGMSGISMTSGGSSSLLNLFITENLSIEPRYAKLRLRYDRFKGSVTPLSANVILTVEQKGCVMIGSFGKLVSGAYSKQLVMESVEEESAPMTWTAAQDICAEKFYDVANKKWYLPSQAQLAAIWIANYDSKNTLKDSYWSATEAWGMDMRSGILKNESQALKKVRCVRDIDTNI